MEKIAVIGAGTMGAGIAQTFASKGYKVALIDISKDILNQAKVKISSSLERFTQKGAIDISTKDNILGNLSYYTEATQALACAALAIEAVHETIEAKHKIFNMLDEVCKPDCLLATNTSSLSITKIASATKRPQRVIGMHFMNPVPMMKLVEVISGYATEERTLEQSLKYIHSLDKIPVQAKDYPGFVANRLLMPMINEAILTLSEGVAHADAIDEVMRLGMAHPMGPLQLADFIGLDICLNILRVLHENFGLDKYAPAPRLVNMVEAGFLGVKTSEGFYIYKDKGKIVKPATRF